MNTTGQAAWAARLVHRAGVAGFLLGLIAAATPGHAQVTTFPVAPHTTSQSNSDQLNQLFLFETTNDKSAANEGYATASFDYLDFRHKEFQYRYQLQGQYSFTDQIAVGGFIPLIHSRAEKTRTGFGDITIYGQYKLDQFVPHNIVDLTAQLDIVLPTGSRSKFRDTGKWGVRPMIQAFRDLGQLGPGHVGVYGEMGVTLTHYSDFRWGLAAQYEYQQFAYGILEFYDQAGGDIGRPLVTLTPGIAIRPKPFELSLGFPFGLNDGSPRWGVVLKATYFW